MNISKNIIQEWIAGQNFTHFISIQLPLWRKMTNFDKAQEALREITKNFERQLLGRNWHRKHLPFFATAETGISLNWHFHLLLNGGEYTTQELNTALSETRDNMNLDNYALDLEQITYTPEVLNFYCMKEIKIAANGKFDTNRIIPSQVLFSVPVKQK
jgi:hypothetical protein